ncbi:MAG: hypothetical protein QF535_09815, partial [Anaerolineales bacterium]|nr:hypothetical protein [Anaerolineales bacterium]
AVTFYKNNATQGELVSGITDDVCFFVAGYNTCDAYFNFGSDSSFAGNKTAQGNQDGNGIGDFYYTPPSGFNSLCSENLPSAEIALPTDHFDAALWTGNSSTQTVTSSLNFQPDFLWTKLRSHTDHHIFRDIVRDGSTTMVKSLRPSHHGAEYTGSGSLTTTSNGFSVSGHDGGEFNYNTYTYVTWNWKAGGTASSNTDGTITSSVSANPTAGFSIVSYTGVGPGSAANEETAGHGLSETPEVVIVKKRSASGSWFVYTTVIDGSNDYLYLDTAAAKGNSGNTVPSSTVFNFGGVLNTSSATYIAYCFHSVDGYSKVGSYTGNGNADGPMIFAGFRPAFFMVKNASTLGTDWRLYDDKRPAYNPVNVILYPDTSGVESSTSHPMDFVSNGIKNRGTFSEVNTSGDTYIYIAFAESPFKYSNAR